VAAAEEVGRQATWLYLWTVPAVQGFFRRSGKLSVAAIYSVFSATSLLTSIRTTRTGAQLPWRALRPDRADGFSQSRSDRFAITCSIFLAVPRSCAAGLSGWRAKSLPARHHRPCDTGDLASQRDRGDVEMTPIWQPGDPSALDLTCANASHCRSRSLDK
jgi:hypothetical protein